jgi:integrase
MDKPTLDMRLVEAVTRFYVPARSICKRSTTYYRQTVRRLGSALGGEALVSDLPMVPRLKLSKCDSMRLISIWRYFSDIGAIEFDEKILGAMLELEIASYRLMMLRNNPDAAIAKPRSDMPLLDFVMCHYMNAVHHRGRKAAGFDTLYKLRRVTKLARDFLGREVLVSDLTPRNSTLVMDAFKLKYAESSRKEVSALWLSLWRYAADLGLLAKENLPPSRKIGCRAANKGADGEPVKLDTSEGTLWHICRKLYFPKNLRISCDKTKHQYRCALRDFKQYLGHDPTAADLTDDNVIGMMRLLMDKGLAAKTVNERRGRIRALWEWMARKRMVHEFPFVSRVKAPKRIPRAWTRNELATLFEACRTIRGRLPNGVLSCDWWTALHLILWDTGARIGEIIRCQWEWLDYETGQLVVPAEARKGQDRDMAYRLHSTTLATLSRLRQLHCKLIFGEITESRLYHEYRRLKRDAGLPQGSKHGFHKMRRTVASWLEAGGYNACNVLQHSSPEVTRNHYLDPTITGGVHPSEVLFRPTEEVEPRRIGFAG